MGAFTLTAQHWFAWQMLPGYVGERVVPYCSPIWIESVVPQKSGQNILAISFLNPLYAEGAQTFELKLQILKRATDYLIAELADDPATTADRCAVIARVEFQWIERFCPELWTERSPLSCSIAAQASVAAYLDEVFRVQR